MLKILLAAAPYILKAPRRSPEKKLAGMLASIVFFSFAALFILIGAFIFAAREYGSDIAFIALGVVFLIMGIIFFTKSHMDKRDRKKAESVAGIAVAKTDPLAKLFPETIKNNPTVEKLLTQIATNPVTAVAAALSLGLLLAHEFLEDKDDD